MSRSGVLAGLSLMLATTAAGQSPGPASEDRGASLAAKPATEPSGGRCTDKDPNAVVVCGRSSERYRIDRSVLEASRAHDAPPPKPQVMADTASDSGCIGGQGCTGGVVPLIGMALVALKAADLAAKGDDWRDALRTHEDEYRLYKQAEERKARERKVRIFPTVGN